MRDSCAQLDSVLIWPTGQSSIRNVSTRPIASCQFQVNGSKHVQSFNALSLNQTLCQLANEILNQASGAHQ